MKNERRKNISFFSSLQSYILRERRKKKKQEEEEKKDGEDGERRKRVGREKLKVALQLVQVRDVNV